MFSKTTFSILSVAAMLLFSTFSFAQQQNYNWLFSNFAAIEFSTGSPLAFNAYGTIETQEGSASISDENGDLLFFTDGITVWNSEQEIMPNGTGLSGNSSSTQSALIVKKPESDNLYYLFTVDNEGGPDGMRYSIVDMSLDGGLGDITASKNILIENSITEKLTAVLHQNETDIWVVTQKAGTNIYHSYLLTAAGLTLTPVVSSLGEELSNFTSAGVGYLKASPNGLKMANAKFMDDAVDIFDFDNSTGILSNVLSLSVPMPYGIEFSPNNSVLYVTTQAGADLGINQFDLSVCDPAKVQSTRVYLGMSSLGTQSLLLGPDNRIYVAVNLDSYLHVIEYPNNVGLTCNLLVNEVDLLAGEGVGLSIIGLPNFQNTWDYNHHYLTICDNDTVGLVDFTNSTHNWVLESDDLTILSTDSIYYVSPDITTTYIEFDDEDTVFYTVTVKSIPDVFLGDDTILCPGNTLELFDPGNENSTYTWQDGSTDTLFTVHESGTYWVEIINSNCCANSDTINVEYAILDVSLTVDDPTITANGIADAYQWVDCNQDYEFVPGETDQSYSATTNGSYAVILTVDGCVDTSACVEILAFSSIDELMNEQLYYFPNPTTGEVTLMLTDYTKFKNLTVITTDGKILNNYTITNGQLKIELPEANGLYFFQLTDVNDAVSVYKIVKQ